METFERVVARYGATVLRVCQGAGPDSDDAWSETFLAAMRHYPQLEPDANLEAWLVTIARNKVIDQVRARARRAFSASELSVPSEEPREELGDMFDLVRSLPDKQRQVVAYRYLGGLSYKETAAVIGGTPEAARRAGADAMRTLRKLREENR